ncbi:carbon catabolite repressor protein 4 homolog 3 isoform X2 [Hevea brasiliensis]|uniref:carbon catabolite repressor protein 4 homolog 3 isoform X2 n=1 Tax=Hevea brasiliensis TaxID=3981 RepID=UPI0025E5AE06|nr:carbon catabolite repressor protein 4 homolog 3 isoform X2 [Hevea brasiliensis]
MGSSSCASSSWLSPRATVFSLGSSPKREPFSLFFFSCKSTNNTFTCCATSPTDDSSFSPSSSSLLSASYTRRWYNPLRRKPYDHPSPEILRHWVEADQSQASQEHFTMVSYNILGDRNAFKHRDLYQNVDPLYLKWAHRKKVISKELVGWNPDIICLQEVDRYYDLLKVMEKAGYAGSYKRRTGDYADGCAMFWKADKFRMLEGESIEFKALGLRDNVAQLSVFEILEDESRRLLVGNIHVLYSPNRGEIKLGQIRLLLSRAQILAEKWGNIPVVLAGDFNSTPQSAIYKFLASSELNIMLYDRKELSGQRNCDPAQVLGLEKELRNPLYLMDRILKTCWTREAIKVATGDPDGQLLTHPLKLNSSYATLKGSTRTRDLNGEPLATSYHSKFLGTVDYLWYSDGVVPIRVLDTLPFNTLERTGGLPCKKLGSDHLALVSEFAFTPGAKGGSTTSIATVSAAATSSSREDNKST